MGNEPQSKLPCTKCDGWCDIIDQKYVCSQCKISYSLEYLTGFHDGKRLGQSHSNDQLDNVRRQLQRQKNLVISRDRRITTLSAENQSIIKSRTDIMQTARISAADVKRIISEDCRQRELDIKSAPNPKDIDSEYLIWTGAKIRKDITGPQPKYYLKGYSASGLDVEKVVKWLHQM